MFGDEVREFIGVLPKQAFLETEEFYCLREQRHKELREGRERLAVHTGTAYPASPAEVDSTFEE